MKVILKQDIKGVGKAGSVADVAEGYGRNYLLPRGLALEATVGSLAQLAGQREAKERRDEKLLAEAREVAAIEWVRERLLNQRNVYQSAQKLTPSGALGRRSRKVPRPLPAYSPKSLDLAQNCPSARGKTFMDLGSTLAQPAT